MTVFTNAARAIDRALHEPRCHACMGPITRPTRSRVPNVVGFRATLMNSSPPSERARRARAIQSKCMGNPKTPRSLIADPAPSAQIASSCRSGDHIGPRSSPCSPSSAAVLQPRSPQWATPSKLPWAAPRVVLQVCWISTITSSAAAPSLPRRAATTPRAPGSARRRRRRRGVADRHRDIRDPPP